MKADNRPSLVTTLTEKDFKKLQSQADDLGIGIDELAERAFAEGMKIKFKSPLKGAVVGFIEKQGGA